MDAPRTVLLASRQDDFAIYEPEIHRCETDDVPYAIPANDNLRNKNWTVRTSPELCFAA